MDAFAVEVENDSSMEMSWLCAATTYTDDYLKRLLEGPLKGPMSLSMEIDMVVYQASRRCFPSLDINLLNPNDPLGPYLDHEFWSPLLRRHHSFIEDPTMLTLLRRCASKPLSPDNTMLVPRLKFLCIEIARNRDGANEQLRKGHACSTTGEGEEKTMDHSVIAAAASSSPSCLDHHQQQPQLVLIRTKYFWTVSMILRGNLPPSVTTSQAEEHQNEEDEKMKEEQQPVLPWLEEVNEVLST